RARPRRARRAPRGGAVAAARAPGRPRLDRRGRGPREAPRARATPPRTLDASIVPEPSALLDELDVLLLLEQDAQERHFSTEVVGTDAAAQQNEQPVDQLARRR